MHATDRLVTLDSITGMWSAGQGRDAAPDDFAIALLASFGLLFMPCLAFSKTKALFEKWLIYGVATLFSLIMLGFISAIMLQVTLRAASALWATNFINGLLKTSSEGLTTQSLEQGGIGLLMTVLIISVPPMAGSFFNGTLGNFMYFSAFGGGAANRPGPQGQPPGSYGSRVSQSVTDQVSPNQQGGSNGYADPNLGRMTGQAHTIQADVTKTRT